MPNKKPNPQDLTLRNLRAIRKDIKELVRVEVAILGRTLEKAMQDGSTAARAVVRKRLHDRRIKAKQ